jgi:hypothetical protein
LAFASEPEGTKDEIIRGILSDFQQEFFINPRLRGKTFEVVIKDFSVDDAKTYALIDALSSFFVISIPDKRDNPVCGSACSKRHRLGKVRKELIAITRAKGLKRQFTVPQQQEDLPLAK